MDAARCASQLAPDFHPSAFYCTVFNHPATSHLLGLILHNHEQAPVNSGVFFLWCSFNRKYYVRAFFSILLLIYYYQWDMRSSSSLRLSRRFIFLISYFLASSLWPPENINTHIRSSDALNDLKSMGLHFPNLMNELPVSLCGVVFPPLGSDKLSSLNMKPTGTKRTTMNQYILGPNQLNWPSGVKATLKSAFKRSCRNSGVWWFYIQHTLRCDWSFWKGEIMKQSQSLIGI